LYRVDAPDVRAGDHLQCGVVGEHVVKGAGEAAEAVGLLTVGVGLDLGVPAGVEDLHRILLRVRVEVTGEEDPPDAALRCEPVGEGRESLCLLNALAIPTALAGVGVVAGAGAALGLEVVDDHGEGVGVLAAGRLESLRERFTCVVEVDLVAQDLRRSDKLDVRRLVDEGRADHVLLGEGRPDLRGGNVRPSSRTGRVVECVHKDGESVVTVLAVLGGVLDLFQGDDARAQLVDCDDGLGELAVEVLSVRRTPGPAGRAVVVRDRVAQAVGVVGARA
jgi:plasmid stabilization system protein ParE